jgi:hypothetical protein
MYTSSDMESVNNRIKESQDEKDFLSKRKVQIEEEEDTFAQMFKRQQNLYEEIFSDKDNANAQRSLNTIMAELDESKRAVIAKKRKDMEDVEYAIERQRTEETRLQYEKEVLQAEEKAKNKEVE